METRPGDAPGFFEPPGLNKYSVEWTFGILVGVLVLIGHVWFLFAMHQYYNSLEDTAVTKVFDYVTLWVPIFLVTMAMEALWAWFSGRRWYRMNDTTSSLVAGSFSQLIQKLIAQVSIFSPYSFIYNKYALVQLQEGPFAWWLMFIGVEFGYYWVHRTGHTMHFFWAMHSVHHSSEEYNLSTALRQSALHGLVSFMYYLPLAFFFPPALFLVHSQFNLLYQYWIHTRCVPKLGPLEWILNTPSQHRVHHGRNSYCIDTNYGGTLCIFDRLFGTFQEEKENVPVVYGITDPLNSFHGIDANIAPWRKLSMACRSVQTISDKALVLWNGPGQIPGSSEKYLIPACTTSTTQKYHTVLSLRVNVYVMVQFLIALLVQQLSLSLLSTSSELHCVMILGANVFVVWTFHGIGLICDRKGTLSAEAFRLAVGALYILLVSPYFCPGWNATMCLWETIGVSGVAVVFIGWAATFKDEMKQPIRSFEKGCYLPGAVEAEAREVKKE